MAQIGTFTRGEDGTLGHLSTVFYGGRHQNR